MARTSLEVQEVWQRFHDVVNMTSQELSTWLGTAPELDAPHPGPLGPSPLGAAVVGILGKRRIDIDDADLSAMEEVVEIFESETAGLDKEQLLTDECRRHRLMNVGHDPFRER